MPDYVVQVDEAEPMMVRAKNNVAARNYAVREKVKVRSLTTEHAIAMATKGQVLHIAGADVSDSEDAEAQDDGKRLDDAPKPETAS